MDPAPSKDANLVEPIGVKLQYCSVFGAIDSQRNCVCGIPAGGNEEHAGEKYEPSFSLLYPNSGQCSHGNKKQATRNHQSAPNWRTLNPDFLGTHPTRSITQM